MAPKLQPSGQIGGARITQRTMQAFLELEANWKVIKMRYEDESERLMMMLHRGDIDIEDGRLEIIDAQKESKRPSWKEEFIRECGEMAAKEVQDRCIPSISHKLVVRTKATIG